MNVGEAQFKELVTDRNRWYAAKAAFASHERKKLDERLAVEKVYGSRTVAQVIWHERPDFLLRLRSGDVPFGIEVVRSFESESAARLHEMDGYLGHLLSGGDVRHKNDRSGFSVTKIQIHDAEGHVVAADEPAVLTRSPSLAQFVKRIVDAVDVKQRLFDVASEVTHLNLIVDDRTGVLTPVNASELYRYVCTPDLRDTVLRSQFREVFLVTRLKSGPVYVPLKMLLTLARLYLFHAAILASDLAERLTLTDYMAMFAAHLRSQTGQTVGIRPEGDSAEVLYGDTGFIVEEDGEGVQSFLRMYLDAPWPTCETTGSTLPKVPEVLLDALDRIQTENTFATEIAFPVTLQI